MPVPARAHRSTEQPSRPGRVTEPPLRAGRTTEPPAVRAARLSEPPPLSGREHPSRRSSIDHTPLPPPLPYHVADRTSSPARISSGDIELGDETRVDDRPPGLAQTVRRSAPGGLRLPNELDMAAELDTLQRPRIASDDLRKITEPPPTAPIAAVDPLDDLDLETPPPRDPRESTTGRRPIPRGSDDALTPPRTSSATLRPSAPPVRPSVPGLRSPSSPNLSRVGPRRTSSRPPVVSIPPKTSSRPPVVAIPPKHDSHPSGLGLPALPRDSEDEMTMPRDKSPYDDDD